MKAKSAQMSRYMSKGAGRDCRGGIEHNNLSFCGAFNAICMAEPLYCRRVEYNSAPKHCCIVQETKL